MLVSDPNGRLRAADAMGLSATPRLLISVRDLAETEEALAGGADIIDVKEPANGALGRASFATMQAIASGTPTKRVRILSAALGELIDFRDKDAELPAGIRFVKLGTSRLRNDITSKSRFLRAARTLRASAGDTISVVPASYADWDSAGAPNPTEVVRWAVEAGSEFLLVDTFIKDGRGFWDHMHPRDYENLLEDCHNQGLGLAIAGSLNAAAIAHFHGRFPDILGVRGAACLGGSRNQAVSRDRVLELVASIQMLASSPKP